MIVPDPNMFGGSVLLSKKLGSKWKNYKTNKMVLGKINIRTQSSRANESPTNANYRGVGLAEMIYSIQNKKNIDVTVIYHYMFLILLMEFINQLKMVKNLISELHVKNPDFFNKEINSIIK